MKKLSDNQNMDYLEFLGILDPEQPFILYEDGTDDPPTVCSLLLVEWSDGSFSAHTDIENSLSGLFWELDKINDPAASKRMTIGNAEDPAHSGCEWLTVTEIFRHYERFYL